MIHEVTEEITKLDLTKYPLSFDDGLFSQYFYWNLFKDIPTSKVLFIPTGAIRLDDSCRPQFVGKFKTFPTCYKAMERWFSQGDREDYMTLGELKKLREDGAIIGAHSHAHLSSYSDRFITRMNQFREDSSQMKEWFVKYLGEVPETYCFPYNKEYPIMRAVIRVETGIQRFYGHERKAVEELL